jgi:hypothetical protein
MSDPTREIGFARGHDIMVAPIRDAGGENNVAQIHLMLDGAGELGAGSEQWASSVRMIRLGLSLSMTDQ